MVQAAPLLYETIVNTIIGIIYHYFFTSLPIPLLRIKQPVKELLEAAMLICFGVSWPVSANKLFRSRTIKGVSDVFLWMVFTGYVLGTIGKVVYNPSYVLIVYIFNTCMVGTNLVIYYRNKRLERTSN